MNTPLTNKDLFARHVHLGTMVETGSCFGRSIELALELGFHTVLSVEGARDRWVACGLKFSDKPNVKLWLGHSPDKLPEMLAEVKGPALMWLDSHPSGEGSFGQDFETNPAHAQSNVLMAELTIIKNRNMPGDVILVDDLTPDVLAFAKDLFPSAVFTVHDTDEGPSKVLEIHL